METIFINTSNSATNKSNELLYKFIDKLDLKNPNKSMALANLSMYYTCTTSLKYQRQHGTKRLIYQMDHIQLKQCKIILTTS